METVLIKVKGLVQGVGFRPFIYRLAHEHALKGWVENRTDGVLVMVQSENNSFESFKNDILSEKPPASHITEISMKSIDTNEVFRDFSIVKSEADGEEITQVSPDIAVCEDCLNDLSEQAHRIDYPFINCTNCGPRFTIIKDLPYDREKTTMKPFIMCEKCRDEYTDILDRRFHAQPVACNNCGPQYELYRGDEKITGFQEVLETTAGLIENGKILAIKGLGGYFLSCDARNEEAVNRLRIAKNRDGKPFAVMFRDMDSLKEFLSITPEEEEILSGWRRPILLTQKKKLLAPGVSVGFYTTGAMLPYMPFHYLLFEKLNTPAIVLTSGNLSEEPIIISDEVALKTLSAFADAVLTYNREIHNRTDDSVTMFVNKKERIIRRSRGYVPNPIELELNVDGILATGAELVNCFCIGRNRQAILSQHIGDLKNLETLEFYSESIDRYKRLFQFEPRVIAHDMHPDYLSTRWAKSQGVELIPVQHHHAHIAACMAEYGLNDKVIGIAMDGVGYGDDGNIWGGEFLVCDLKDYTREFHFEYVPMPGGDAATKNPWRMAVSYLYKYFGKDFDYSSLPSLSNIPEMELNLVLAALEKNINCPLTSSAGRLFDAVSALAGACAHATFHAEAPMRLEAAIDKSVLESYDFELDKQFRLKKTFEGIIEDVNNNIPMGSIAAKFHNTVISVIFAAVNKISENTGINKVVLSGGTFQNRYLLEHVENLLGEKGYDVISHSRVPSNDGGLALGQLVIASQKRR